MENLIKENKFYSKLKDKTYFTVFTGYKAERVSLAAVSAALLLNIIKKQSTKAGNINNIHIFFNIPTSAVLISLRNLRLKW